jgi:acyl carrier protein
MIVHVGDKSIEFPDDMSQEEIISIIQREFPETPRPNHEDLTTAAVRGADSMDLQELDSSLKPVVKMSIEELPALNDRLLDKFIVIWDNAAYVVDPKAINPQDVIEPILSGDDSEILGYPEKGDCDCCVTKDGEIVTDLPLMKEHAKRGNIIWAANGKPEELQSRALKIQSAMTRMKR